MQPEPKCDSLVSLTARVSSCERRLVRLEESMPRNDLNLADYDGHRRYHANKTASASKLDEYKHEATKKIIIGALGLVLTTIGWLLSRYG